MQRIKVCHIITGLNTGGAETMLYKILFNINNEKFDGYVISLTDKGKIAEKIGRLNIPIFSLNMRRGIPDPRGFIKLIKIMANIKPDIVQTWMYHSDLMGGLVARIINIPVCWNIRHTNLSKEGNKKLTLTTAKLCAILSDWIPQKIICCSEAARLSHYEIGYSKKKIVVIPNGFDLEKFKPNKAAKDILKKELTLPQDVKIVGLVARFHPLKDHLNFIKAAAIIHKKMPNAHFVLCGEGITLENAKLNEWLYKFNMTDYFHLLGRRDDIHFITAAFDIAVSSSIGEGFSNTIGEAMACEVPCVVTDVGDSAYIVGNTGGVVLPRDSKALAEKWEQILLLSDEERYIIGKKARERIQTLFEISSIVKKYEELYSDITKDIRGLKFE